MTTLADAPSTARMELTFPLAKSSGSKFNRQPTSVTDFAQMFSESLKEKDIQALRIKENVPGLVDVMPEVYGGVTGSYENETYRFTIFGTSDVLQKMMDIKLSQYHHCLKLQIQHILSRFCRNLKHYR